jgi:hypothetical protein
MDWNGPWTRRAIIRMLPQAIKAEADQARMHFSAVSAAIAGSLTKGGAKPFLDSLEKVIGQVNESPKEKPRKSGSAKVLDMLKQFGVSVGGKKR